MVRLGHARKLVLSALSALFGVAALYHLATLVLQSFADGGSRVRHGVFIAINLLVAVGLFTRKLWFFWFFTALGLQQLQSHGSALLHAWADEHRIDWQSVLVLVAIPATWALLYFERRNRTARSRPVSRSSR